MPVASSPAPAHLQEKSGSIFSTPSHCRLQSDLPIRSHLKAEQTPFLQPLPVRHMLPFPNHLGNLLLNTVLISFFTGEPQNGHDTPDALLGWVKQTDAAIGNPKFSISIMAPGLRIRSFHLPCWQHMSITRLGILCRYPVKKERVGALN